MEPAALPSDAEAYEALLAELRPQLATAAPCFEEIAAEARITCLLPYRAAPGREDAALLARPRLDGRIPPGIAFLLVDEGSPPETQAATRAACRALGYSYLHLEDTGAAFSRSRCWAEGARHARGEFVFLAELSHLPHEGFFSALLAALAAEGLTRDGTRILALPTLPLSAEGLAVFHATAPADRRPRFQAERGPWQKADARLCQRLWLLAQGGLPGGGEAGLAEGLRLRSAGLFLCRDGAPPLPEEAAPAAEPLACAHAGRSLVFRPNAYTTGRMVRPLLGELLHLRHGTMIRDGAMLARLVRELALDRILFFNPYHSPHMEKLYQSARQQGLPYLCAERGGLPGSSFFDAEGFLSDSGSYGAPRWDQALDAGGEALVQTYIAATLRDRPALEQQPASLGGAALRARLGLAPGERLLIIPLQRPGDTVTRFLTRGLAYDDFLREVRALCAAPPPGWRVAVKTHPLESEALEGTAHLNADGHHVHDLLEACDLVWTFNSGVGLLAMLHERPVLHSGAVFYAVPGVNQAVAGAAEVRACLARPPGFDAGRSRRFLHHLLTRVYSFGEHVTRRRTLTTGGDITETLQIHYEQLVFGGRVYRFGRPVLAPPPDLREAGP